MQLPVIQLSPDRQRQARLVPLVHGLRLFALGLLLFGANRAVNQRLQTQFTDDTRFQEATDAAFQLPGVASVERIGDRPLVLELLDADGQSIGTAIQTSPHSDFLVGYAGPSDVLLVLDADGSIADTRLLRCPDTSEHVRRVVADDRFWQQFVGLPLGSQKAIAVDGVSGATLTSLSIAQSIVWRLRVPEQPAGSDLDGDGGVPQPIVGSLPSVRFPEAVTVEQVRRWYPELAEIRTDDHSPFWLQCFDADGNWLGNVIRTGPLDDRTIGYQGPSELLLRLDTNTESPPEVVTADRVSGTDQVADVMILSSFDNEPYVGYVRQERSFWRRFRGISLSELAEIDFDEKLIDGVSGATMTSMAVAETLRRSAATSGEHWQQLKNKATATSTDQVATGELPIPSRPVQEWNWSGKEIGTSLLVIAAIVWSRSRWRGNRRTRLLWQITAFVWLGVVSGHLLSLALLGGWVQSGGAWRLAPGLGLLVLISMLGPVVMKGNLYCDQMCPHGIFQQWIRPRQSRRVPNWLRVVAMGSAWLSLAYAIIGGIWIVSGNPLVPLAWLEPFDGYTALRLIDWQTVSIIGLLVPSVMIAILSLLAARRWPMFYCRLACPTGRGLDFLRRDASRHRITIADGVLVGAIAVIYLA